jgi:hypothetical protein
MEEEMSKLSTLRRRWRKDPDFRAEYDALREEFALTVARIDARADLAEDDLSAGHRSANPSLGTRR